MTVVKKPSRAENQVAKYIFDFEVRQKATAGNSGGGIQARSLNTIKFHLATQKVSQLLLYTDKSKLEISATLAVNNCNA